MSAAARLQPLLTLRNRKVSQALQQVEACNRVLREKELERDVARGRWSDAVQALRKQQQAHADVVAGHLHRDLSSSGLAIAVARCDWWRARIEEFLALLQAAEGVLVLAQAAAQRARQDYLRALARYDALVTYAERQKVALVAERLHAEELAAEELQMSRSPRYE